MEGLAGPHAKKGGEEVERQPYGPRAPVGVTKRDSPAQHTGPYVERRLQSRDSTSGLVEELSGMAISMEGR